jgi:ATP-binding cassette subfamily B protein
VAHRASTVLLADRVALLDTAEVAGTVAHTITHIGTHDELLAGVPRYRYLLAADDQLDDGCEPQPLWETDDARARLDRSREEANDQRTLGRRLPGYAASEEGSR